MYDVTQYRLHCFVSTVRHFVHLKVDITHLASSVFFVIKVFLLHHERLVTLKETHLSLVIDAMFKENNRLLTSIKFEY